MRMLRSAIFLLLVASPLVRAAELVVLTPMTAGDRPVMRAGPKGEAQAPIFKRASDDALTKKIAVEASRGAVKFMLALDEQAQRIAGAPKPSPTYLLRSRDDGGFAREGFWLSGANNNVTWHADPYVDLAIDAGSVADGSFEEIFAHEMGHVLLRRLLPKLPNGFSRNAHSSLAITDYPTAFDEGLAIHLQGLARLLTQNARLEALDRGIEFKPFLPYWQSNLDRSLRLRGMRENLFVHQQVPVALSVGDASASFDLMHFKSGQQMLSSEGVVATLFYHLLLQPPTTGNALNERYKSLLHSLRALNNQKLSSGTPIFLSLVQTHVQRVPAAREHWIDTVLNITYGATASTTVIRDLPTLSALGQEGRTTEFTAALKKSRAALGALKTQLLRSPQRLGAALGPELWLAMKDRDGNVITLNLNTAEKTTLMNSLNLTSLDADLMLADRATHGAFADVADFAKRRNVSPLIRKRLEDAHQLALQTGGFARE